MRAHALLLAMLALIPLAALTPTGAALEHLCPTPAPAPEATGEARVWEGPVPEGAEGGNLTITVERGMVHLAPWHRRAYRVEAPWHWDRGSTVRAGVTDGRFDLDARLRLDGWPLPDAPVAPDPGPPVVVVRVPDLLYAHVEVTADGALDTAPHVNASGSPPGGSRAVVVDRLRAHALQAVGRHGGVETQGVQAHHLRVASAEWLTHVADTTTNTTKVEIDRNAACLVNHRAHVVLAGGTGDVVVEGGHVTNLTARMQRGDLVAHGVRVGNLTLTTGQGRAEADVSPTGSGRLELQTRRGAARLTVPTWGDRGYNVTLRADRPEMAEHDLPGARAERDGGEVRLITHGFAHRATQVHALVHARDGEAAVRGHGQPAPARPAAAAAVAPAAVGLSAAALALIYLLRDKLQLLLGALYSRIGRDDVLRHPARRRIVEAVAGEPGIHFNALRRRMGLARGTLEHHLGKLTDTGLVTERAEGGYRCLFPAGAVDRRVMDAAPALRSENARRVLAAVRERPGRTVSDLAAATGIAVSSVSYLLEKLTDAGLLEKRREGRTVTAAATPLGERAARELRLE